MALVNQGTVYITAGELPAAVSKLEEALRIETHSAVASPMEIAATQSRLGEALLALGRIDEGERTVKLALAGLAAGGDSVETAIALNNLALLHQWRRQYGEAIEVVAKSIAIMERICGPEHPLLLRPLNNLAVLYATTNRNAEAETAFRRAQALSEKMLPPDHPAYGVLLANYAAFLRKTGEKALARSMEEHARAILRDNNRRDGRSLTVDVAAFRP